MTAAGLQGRGIGSATVTAAKRLIEQNLASDLGVLLCRQKLTQFYSRLGWKPAAAPVFIHQGENRTEWPHGCMLFAANAEIPPDPGLDLGGPPF